MFAVNGQDIHHQGTSNSPLFLHGLSSFPCCLGGFLVVLFGRTILPLAGKKRILSAQACFLTVVCLL